MVQILNKVIQIIASIQLWMSSILLVAMMGINLFEIVSRKIFNYSLYWVQEATILLAVWVIFLIAAYLFSKKELIRIDFAVAKFPSYVQNYIYLFSDLLIGFFLYYLIIYGIKLQIIQSITTSYAMNVPSNLFSLPLVICAASMAIVLLSNIMERLTLIGRREQT